MRAPAAVDPPIRASRISGEVGTGDRTVTEYAALRAENDIAVQAAILVAGRRDGDWLPRRSRFAVLFEEPFADYDGPLSHTLSFIACVQQKVRGGVNMAGRGYAIFGRAAFFGNSLEILLTPTTVGAIIVLVERVIPETKVSSEGR